MATPKGGYAPNLDKFVGSLKSRPVNASVELLISLLKRRQIRGSEACAEATAKLFRDLVTRDKWIDVPQLLSRVQTVGSSLACAQPHEIAIGNVVRRILGLIREEATQNRNDDASETVSEIHNFTPSPLPPGSPAGAAKGIRPPALNALGSLGRTQSMFHLLSDPESTVTTPALGSGTSTPLVHAQNANLKAIREEIVDGINEIIDEIEQVDEQVQGYSDAIILPTDHILVYRPSRSVQKFLTKASSKRRFTVFLAADGPSDAGEDPYHTLRKSLEKHGSSLINVMNTGLMPCVARANKVIIGARAITCQGSVIVDAGAAVIARAAKELGRSVVVLGSVYKITPDSYFDQLIEWESPSKHVNFGDGNMVGKIRIRSALSESIHANYIDTYVTNLGAHSRDQLHTIISDHYKEEDMDLELYGEMQR